MRTKTFKSNNRHLLLKFAVIGAHGAPYEVRTLRLPHAIPLRLLAAFWPADRMNTAQMILNRGWYALA